MTDPNPALRSFSKWNEAGRRVHKGAKARGFEDGEALFSLRDTYVPQIPRFPGAQRRMSVNLGVTGPWDEIPH